MVNLEEGNLHVEAVGMRRLTLISGMGVEMA